MEETIKISNEIKMREMDDHNNTLPIPQDIPPPPEVVARIERVFEKLNWVTNLGDYMCAYVHVREGWPPLPPKNAKLFGGRWLVVHSWGCLREQ